MRRIDADAAKSLANVLCETRRLLGQSKDSIWATSTVSETLAFIDEQIASLDNSQTCRSADLEKLFAPTGTLQETAIDNGWGNQLLSLTAEFDQLMHGE